MKKRKAPRFSLKNDEVWDYLTREFTHAVFHYFGISLRNVQTIIAREIIKRTFLRKRHTIVLSICRQVGKTELVAMVQWFLSFKFPALEKQKYNIAVVAPEKDTSSLFFDKLKGYIRTYESEINCKLLVADSKTKIKLTNGTNVDTFGLFKMAQEGSVGKSTKEGRTNNVLIRDEMHMGDDKIYRDQLLPSLTTTGGLDIFIGNGGFSRCMAKDLCESEERDDVTVFRYDFDFMKIEMLDQHEKMM